MVINGNFCSDIMGSVPAQNRGPDVLVNVESWPADEWYRDTVWVMGTLGAHSFACSAWPNNRSPFKGILWKECYTAIAPGEYRYACVNHWRFGKCLRVSMSSGSLDIPARLPNAKHGGKRIAVGIYAHRGWTAFWRGSAGCVTIRPDRWAAFQRCFKVGQAGVLKVTDLVTVVV